MSIPTQLEISIEQALYAYLASLGICDGRIYPRKLPGHATLPAIAYQRYGTPPQMTHGGPSSYALSRIQLGVMANTYSDALFVSQQLHWALAGATGTWSGVLIFGCTVDSDVDAPEPLDSLMHRRLLEVSIEHAATGGN